MGIRRFAILAAAAALLSSGVWVASGEQAPFLPQTSAPAADTVPTATATAVAPTPDNSDPDFQAVPFHEEGGSSNIVNLNNNQDGRFRFDGRADFVRVQGGNVTSRNEAQANASCTDCQTIAVALQLVVYKQGAQVVAPENAAIAINDHCTRCVTIARAVQYVIPVADPNDVPKDVKDLTKEINREMHALEGMKSLTQGNTSDVESQIDTILTRFDSLRSFLKDNRDEKDGDNAQASPTPTQTPPAAQPATNQAAPAQAAPATSPTSTQLQPATAPTAANTPVTNSNASSAAVTNTPAPNSPTPAPPTPTSTPKPVGTTAPTGPTP